MFHRWLSTDTPGEDQCIGCGVVSPDFGEGVASDHGPLPITCPGPDVERPHHFVAGFGETIECAVCTIVLDGTTLPADVEWECPDPWARPVVRDQWAEENYGSAVALVPIPF